jgi:methylenetetrahydrofolate dehydrogenase (NADP+)/methenyltetrahydrofolate cyclohydrolase
MNGILVAQKLLSKLEDNVSILKAKYNNTPKLAIILVGNNISSEIYVKNKLREARKIAMEAIQINLPASIDNDSLFAEIHQLNQDPSISGIIIQLPLPLHIDKIAILSSIDPNKDVDGFHPLNVGHLHNNSSLGFIPCTPLAILGLIKEYESNLAGKHVVMIGRSTIVGKPISALLLQSDATVTICHSHSRNLSRITSSADIVISAIGIPLFLNVDYFSSNSMVIDVGITRLANSNKIVGDVDFQNVVNKVKYITPVPGGVGPMTIAYLLINTYKACIKQNNY